MERQVLYQPDLIRVLVEVWSNYDLQLFASPTFSSDLDNDRRSCSTGNLLRRIIGQGKHILGDKKNEKTNIELIE